MKADAVVLAGRYNDGKLKEVSGEALEANIKIAGKPMVQYVLDAVLKAKDVASVYLVGPSDELKAYEGPRVTVVQSGQDIMENIKRGIERCRTDFILVLTSDIPLITSSILDELMVRFEATGADFCYPVCYKEDVERKYPGSKRTYARVKEGTFTGGNVFFARKEVVENAWPFLTLMVRHRKSPVKMASFLGWSLLLKIALGRAGIEEIERRVSTLLGIVPRAIPGAPPEVGVDVDKPEDYELCSRVLSSLG
ncbi:MAG: nucleotidyltransferase family protein [Firmicutes bacterium]|nr:nucleotidyltransferase family protein [Candidatus Fermentithermobacillaceae bacterium]